MYENLMSFSTVSLAVYSMSTTLIASGEVSQDTVTNIIITVLASAVAILWKKVDSYYKKVEIENAKFKAELLVQEKRNDICEEDRVRIQKELDDIKKNGCHAGCSLKGPSK